LIFFNTIFDIYTQCAPETTPLGFAPFVFYSPHPSNRKSVSNYHSNPLKTRTSINVCFAARCCLSM